MIVGREDDLARLAAAAGSDTATAVVGEAGIGKTTLLRAAARTTGRRVFEGGALSTLGWIDYLALERALGRRMPPGDPATVAIVVEEEVGDGLLMLDDLQWAAAATLEVISYLAGRVGLLLGVRVGDAAADRAVDHLRRGGVAIMRIDALAPEQARALLNRMQPDLTPSAVDRLVGRAGGNPFLLRELAETGEMSASLRLALAARLRRLDEPGREAFGLLALAGRPVSRDRLGAAGAKSLLAADLAVETDADRIEVRHSLLAEVAIEEMSGEERRRLHAILARNVDDPGEAARHYAQAGERAAAFTSARRAAAAAARPGERASHLAIAASCADGPDADALRVEAAHALETAHDWPALSALLDQLRDADEPKIRASGALIRARSAWRSGDPEGLRTALADGLALVQGTGSDVEVQLRIEASRIPIFVDADPEAAVRSTTAALEAARAAGGVDLARAQYLHGTALYVMQRPEGAQFLAEAVAAARESGDIGTEMVASNNLIAFHESLGDPQFARRVASEMVTRAADLGLGVWERSFRMALSNLDFHAGNYPAVLAAADELLAQPLEARTRDSLFEQLCLALIDTGRIEEAERRVEALPERPGEDWTWKRQVAWVRTEAALWGGRPQLALEFAEEILRGPEGDANIAFARISRAWALFDLDRDPGPPVVGEYPAMLAAVPDETAGICLLHAGSAGAAVDAFDSANRIWGGYHRRGEIRCAWAAGEAARRAGSPDAVERLLRVEQQAVEYGMAPLLTRTERSLRAAGVRRAAPVRRTGKRELTDRERQVLHLVGAGLTNAQIAARLGVSRHTVISQVSSASAKLGARSRTHAASLADAAQAG